MTPPSKIEKFKCDIIDSMIAWFIRFVIMIFVSFYLRNISAELASSFQAAFGVDIATSMKNLTEEQELFLQNSKIIGRFVASIAIAFFSGSLYYVLYPLFFGNATIGMKVSDLKVAPIHRSKVSFWSLSLRYFFGLVFTIIPIIVLMMIFMRVFNAFFFFMLFSWVLTMKTKVIRHIIPLDKIKNTIFYFVFGKNNTHVNSDFDEYLSLQDRISGICVVKC